MSEKVERDNKSADMAEGTTKPIPMSEHDLELEVALANYVPGGEAEKKLVRKVDLIMLPALWFMYILAYIDRQNIVSRLHRVVAVDVSNRL